MPSLHIPNAWGHVMKVTDFSHTYAFPQVPYRLGLRHLHSPGYICSTQLRGISDTHIINVSHPFKFKDFCSVTFLCSCSLFDNANHSVHMYTTERSRSSMVISQGDKAYMVLDIHAEENGTGHILQINGTVIGGPEWIHKSMDKHLSNTITVDLASSDWADWTQDPRLTQYRHMALRD